MSGNLISPGVDVSIINEAFYASAGQGTIPLIFMATAANKTAPSGSGIAPMTAPANAGKLFLATSQRELISNYGNPNFVTSQGTPVFGDERNEWGLHAAYSYLGIANQCYVLRADIDTSQLAASPTAPVGAPLNGTYWLDLSATAWGLFVSNGNSQPGLAWASVAVKVAPFSQVDSNFLPLASYGNDGDYAVVPWTTNNFMYERINGAWYQIGSASWAQQYPTSVRGTVSPAAVTTGDTITINGVTVAFASPGDLTTVVSDINAAFAAANNTSVVASVSNNALLVQNVTGGNLVFTAVNGATALTVLGIAAAGTTTLTIPGVAVTYTSNASYPAGGAAGSLWVRDNPTNQGANWVIRYYQSSTGWTAVSAPFAPFDSTLADGNPAKDSAASTLLGSPAVGTLYVGYDASTGVQQIRRFSGNWGALAEALPGAPWETLEYEADTVAPTTAPAAGTYWYNDVPQVDIMVTDGSQWHGYRRIYPNTDSTGVILSGSAPTQQVGGHSGLDSNGNPTTVYTLVDNDLWLDTSNLESYPQLYRWSTVSQSWNLIDLSDHVTPFGIVFGDARQDSGVSYTGIPNAGAYAYNSTKPVDLTQSDYVDPDAPIADAYPSGVLLFNTRYSTGNVKVWNPTYFKAGGYDATDFTINSYASGNPNVTFPPVSSAGRWVTASGNSASTGAPYMMRHAQRIMIINAIAAQIASNQDIRSELVHYNLIAAPGYVELLSDLETLNVDQKEVSFIVGDTPMRLASDSNTILNWATNTAGAASDGDQGLVTHYDYAGIYYPWGLGEDAFGNEVMIPSSTIALRTIAYNDQVAYPWFAPAGFTRGLVTNATSVGYLTSGGTYQTVILNQGQRDTLYSNLINPIAYIPGRGLVVYGQITLGNDGSLLSRINVARLVNYVRYQLDLITRPYLFEQNDSVTRKTAKNTVERFFNSLVGQRALADYAVVCDTSNNTPAEIDANQLWIDCMIQPITAVEFIYIPVRVESASSASNVNTTSTITTSTP